MTTPADWAAAVSDLWKSLDPIGVGDLASVLFFILGRLSVSRPGIMVVRAAQAAIRLKAGR